MSDIAATSCGLTLSPIVAAAVAREPKESEFAGFVLECTHGLDKAPWISSIRMMMINLPKPEL